MPTNEGSPSQYAISRLQATSGTWYWVEPEGFWQAKLKLGGGKYQSKSFSILTHGNEGAYQMAVAARKEMLANTQDRPYLYDPLAKQLATEAT